MRQIKHPYNNKKQPHGFWKSHATNDGSYYRLHFVNGEIFGYLEVYDGNVKQKNNEYHAR